MNLRLDQPRKLHEHRNPVQARVSATRLSWRELITWSAAVAVCVAAVAALSSTDASARKRRHRPKHHHGLHRHHAASPAGDDTDKPIERTVRLARCPAEMVNVAGHFCIDRWEAITVDEITGAPLSPYYPPDPRLARMMYRRWSARAAEELTQARAIAREAGVVDTWWTLDASDTSWWDAGDAPSRIDLTDDADGGVDSAVFSSNPRAPWGWVLIQDARTARPVMNVPTLPPWQQGKFSAVARSRPHAVPQGYTPGFVADRACRAAHKRLCRRKEWVMACEGENRTKFPYGPNYRQGKCNVFRQSHPALILHGSFSIGLSDPRLNLVEENGTPLLRRTGETPTCASRWGDDVIYDMVGNVDEWVDDPRGMFVGGFYARNTRNGCEARVRNHPKVYFDYSIGFRCCADLQGGDRD